MDTSTIIILCLIIYVLSFMGAYKYIQLTHHHPEGRWHNLKPGRAEIVICFMPIANTMATIIFIVIGWKKGNKTNFFKP